MDRRINQVGKWMLWTAFFSFLFIFYSGWAHGITLEESIDIALKNSVVVDVAKAGLKGAQAQKREAMTGFLPKLSTTYSYTHLNEPPNMTIPAIPPIITSPQKMDIGVRDNYNWSVDAKQPLYAGGAIIANYDINRFGEEAAKLEEHIAVQDIIRDVKEAYYSILKAQKLLEVAKQSVERLNAHVDMARSFYEVGIIPLNDVLYSEVELANGQRELIRAENGVERIKSRFNVILRRDINTPVEVEDILAYRAFDRSLESCLGEAMAKRMEIRIQELRLEQAKAFMRVMASEYYPAVNLVGSYGRYGEDTSLNGSSYKDSESWSVMAVANWNFWEWGRTKNRVEFGRQRERQAKDLLIGMQDRVTLELKDAYLSLREAEKQVDVAKRAIAQAEENYRITEERYREQVSTSTDVLDALTLLTRAKSDYTNALGDYHINYTRLERAMGLMDTVEKK
jgi:outer membrane protein TolC